jgi:hypothetical protein
MKSYYILLCLFSHTHGMDNNPYTFSKDIQNIHEKPNIQEITENSDASLKALAALSKKVTIFSREDINEIAYSILPPNGFYSIDFKFNHDESQIAIMSHAESSHNKNRLHQLTIFSIKDQTILFNDSFYHEPISMQNFNFEHNKLAFTVKNDPFLFIAALDRINKTKTIIQYNITCNFSRASCIFDKEARKFIFHTFKQEKSVQAIYRDVINKNLEATNIIKMEEQISLLIDWDSCFIIDLE